MKLVKNFEEILSILDKNFNYFDQFLSFGKLKVFYKKTRDWVISKFFKITNMKMQKPLTKLTEIKSNTSKNISIKLASFFKLTEENYN